MKIKYIMYVLGKFVLEILIKMKTGVVILNYNSWEITEKLARKLAMFSIIDEVVVVDNISTDDSYVHLKTINSSKILVVQSKKNGGYSYGNNFGAKILVEHGCDIIIISNPDVDVEEESIQKIINEFEEKSEFGILSGVEYDASNHISNPPIWNMNSYKDDLVSCFYLGRKLMRENVTIDYTRKIQPINIVKGSFFAIRTKVFLDIDGFDENVFLFCEERIISRKVKECGKLIGLVTTAKYNHNHSVSINKEYKSKAKQIKILYRSRYYYNCKYNSINMYKKVLLRIGMAVSLAEYGIFDVLKKMRGHS